MPDTVEAGQEWFVVSMKWILKWQQHVGFESVQTDRSQMKGPDPGKMDNRDIILDEGKKPELEELSKNAKY